MNFQTVNVESIDIMYHVHRSKTESDLLVVSFPGGGEGATQLGYMFSIQKYNVNALYFTSSQLGKRTRFIFYKSTNKIEHTVKAIIDKTVKDLNCKYVVVLGSSLGGYSALYYGIKYNYHVIAGSPPYKFFDKKIIEVCTSESESDRASWLNEQLKNVIAGKKKEQVSQRNQIFISFGSGEPNWTGFGKELIDDLNDAHINCLCKLYNFSSHETVHSLFPKIIDTLIPLYIDKKSTEEIKNSFDAMNTGTTKLEKIDDQIRKIYELVLSIPDDYDKSSKIVQGFHFGKKSQDLELRDYVYAACGWLFDSESNKAQYLTNEQFYLNDCVKFPEILNYLDGILHYYEYHPTKSNACILKWCLNNYTQYLDSIKPKTKFKFTETLKSFHYVLSLCNQAGCRDENISKDLLIKLNGEVKRYLIGLLKNNPSKSYVYMYQVILAVFHACIHFKYTSQTLITKLNEANIELLNMVNEYCLNPKGLCSIGQVATQAEISKRLHAIYSFLNDNETLNIKSLSKFKVTYKKICNLAAMLTTPNKSLIPLGHTTNTAQRSLLTQIFGRTYGDYIDASSNIAILSNDYSYITVCGGQNYNSVIKHSDLLSFTWNYKGNQLFCDAGGGTDELFEYACSAAAHNTLICDDYNPVIPAYYDFTSIDSFKSENNVVVINMSHALINGVLIKRHFIFIKPNVVILVDKAESKDLHKFSQNFLIGSKYEYSNLNRGISFLVSDSLTMNIIEHVNAESTINIISGDENSYCGNVIKNMKELSPGLNLSISEKGRNVIFITSIDITDNSVTNNGLPEHSVKNVSEIDGKVNIIFNDSSTMTIDL